MTPVMQAASDFALVGGITFTALGIYLSVRQRRVHPLLLLCISAMSFSWIEAPYDWAMYAQFPPAIPRMPSWWPLNMTWGGLPLFVPVGYISYFVLPAVTGAAWADGWPPGSTGADHRRCWWSDSSSASAGRCSSTGSSAPSSACSITAA